MIAIPGNVRVWLATGHTDMRRGFPSLARLVQESLKRDPHTGDLYVFRGRRGDLIKIIWHDGQGACLKEPTFPAWLVVVIDETILPSQSDDWSARCVPFAGIEIVTS